jgi:hypothetical protein
MYDGMSIVWLAIHRAALASQLVLIARVENLPVTSCAVLLGRPIVMRGYGFVFAKLRYEAAIERIVYRWRAELLKVQRMR